MELCVVLRPTSTLAAEYRATPQTVTPNPKALARVTGLWNTRIDTTTAATLLTLPRTCATSEHVYGKP